MQTKPDAPEYSQLVLIEYDNACPGVTRFKSKRPIRIEHVASYLAERDGFNESQDAITFIDEPDEAVLPDEESNNHTDEE